MRSSALSVLCATLFIFLAAPVLAEVSGFECSGPGGPFNGTPDDGLYTAGLTSDKGYGVNIGVDELKFTLTSNRDILLTDIQLWTDTDISSIPVKVDGLWFQLDPSVNNSHKNKHKLHANGVSCNSLI